jgi:hypothetical protein
MKSPTAYITSVKQITTLARRFAAFVNPPGLPGDAGSMPRVRDYPIAKPSFPRR